MDIKTQANNSEIENKDNVQKEPQTYFSANNNNGLLEIDLVTLREKNQKIRYLGISFSGQNPQTNEDQNCFVEIDNEEQFLELKKFFAQLEWNS